MGEQGLFDRLHIIRLAVSLGTKIHHADLSLDGGCKNEEKENTEFDRGHGPDTMDSHGFLPDMNYCPLLYLLTCLCCGASLADVNTSLGTEPATAKTDFIRFIENDQGASLQSDIASYTSLPAVIVDLIGAVHIGDQNYVDAPNQCFKRYDSVLDEIVGRPVEQWTEMKVADSNAKLQWLGQIQESMRKKLVLESQLQGIENEAPSIVHADMSSEGFGICQTTSNISP
jgi:hypothetical protein